MAWTLRLFWTRRRGYSLSVVMRLSPERGSQRSPRKPHDGGARTGGPGHTPRPTEPGAGTTGGAWIHNVVTGSCSLGVTSVCLPQAGDSHAGGVGADALLLGKSFGRVPGVGGRGESSLNPLNGEKLSEGGCLGSQDAE